jgi:hypothetical protein
MPEVSARGRPDPFFHPIDDGTIRAVLSGGIRIVSGLRTESLQTHYPETEWTRRENVGNVV